MPSISEIWDRFWWSLLITIFIGLMWLKFLDPYIPCAGLGLMVASAGGLTYFIQGIRKMIHEKRLEQEVERMAIEDA
jgi:hypothetical protein